jgi:hypothetical protein
MSARRYFFLVAFYWKIFINKNISNYYFEQVWMREMQRETLALIHAFLICLSLRDLMCNYEERILFHKKNSIHLLVIN